MKISVLGSVENIVEKRENASNAFSPFPTLFPKKSGFKFNACKLAKCGLKLKNVSSKIKHSILVRTCGCVVNA